MSIIAGPLLWLLGQLFAPLVGMAVYVLIFPILAMLIVLGFIAYIYIRYAARKSTRRESSRSTQACCGRYRREAVRAFGPCR